VPLPLSLAPPVTVIQLLLLTAVQAQPEALVTLTLPVVADDEIDRDVVDSVKLHGTPACVTVNVWPATVTVPVRALADVLALTE
jgi:hypothetical protein